MNWDVKAIQKLQEDPVLTSFKQLIWLKFDVLSIKITIVDNEPVMIFVFKNVAPRFLKGMILVTDTGFNVKVASLEHFQLPLL